MGSYDLPHRPHRLHRPLPSSNNEFKKKLFQELCSPLNWLLGHWRKHATETVADGYQISGHWKVTGKP